MASKPVYSPSVIYGAKRFRASRQRKQAVRLLERINKARQAKGMQLLGRKEFAGLVKQKVAALREKLFEGIPEQEKQAFMEEAKLHYEKLKSRQYYSVPEMRQRILEKHKKYRALPKVKQRIHEKYKEYYERPEVKERILRQARERYQRPEVKQRRKEYSREYILRQDVKERQKQAYQKWYAKPETKQRTREYLSRPDVRQRRKEYWQEYYSNTEIKKKILAYKREYSKRGDVQAKKSGRAKKQKAIFYADLKVLAMEKSRVRPIDKMLHRELIKTLKREMNKLRRGEQYIIKSVFFEGRTLEGLTEFERTEFEAGLEKLRQSKALSALME